MRRVVVIAPREPGEARAAVAAIRALRASSAIGEVEVFATPEAGEVLGRAGISAGPLAGGVRAVLSERSPEVAILLDSREADALEAREAGVGLRMGWGARLGELTHAVQPARFEGRVFRPDEERLYLDVVGLCGALRTEVPVERDSHPPEGRVLVRLPNWLGDLVQCEPLLSVFRGSTARLSLVGPDAAETLFGEVLKGATWLSREEGARAWRGHELALLLDGSLRSAWRAARARIERRVSWARGGKTPWLTAAVRPPRELGGAAIGCGRPGSYPRWLPRPFEVSVAELASAAGIRVPSRGPRLVADDAGRRAAVEFLEAAGIGAREPYVLATVGGRSGSAKAPPLETWRALLVALRERSGVPVLLTCGPGEEWRMQALVQLGLPEDVSRTPGAIGLGALLGLLERASTFVAADSGPRHLAAALGRPSVILHGPTDPRHSSVSGGAIRTSSIEVPCGPCHLERCPLSGSEHLACFGAGHATSAAAMLCELLAEEREDTTQHEPSR
jgi:heptosyltransferase-2